MREIKEAIQSVVAEMMPRYSVPGTVVGGSYDSENGTVDVLPDNGDAEILDVRIQASFNPGKGIVCVPEDGSAVIVTFLGNNDAFISMYSEVKSVILLSDNYGGLVKVEELTDRLNSVEKALSDLIIKYNTHTHPVAGITAGSASVTSAVTPAVEKAIVTETQREQIENLKVQHGDA